MLGPNLISFISLCSLTSTFLHPAAKYWRRCIFSSAGHLKGCTTTDIFIYQWQRQWGCPRLTVGNSLEPLFRFSLFPLEGVTCSSSERYNGPREDGAASCPPVFLTATQLTHKHNNELTVLGLEALITITKIINYQEIREVSVKCLNLQPSVHEKEIQTLA